MSVLIDSFGRAVRDLRISVTDRCNFRCVYCMPAEGLPWAPRENLMTIEEIVRIARSFVEMGIDQIKVTGGEPTARRDIVEIIAALRAVDGALDISITTNGQRLAQLAQPLKDAGLDRVTVSCDSLLRHRFAELTRRDALDAVIDGLHAARAAGLEPIKINCVVMAQANDDEALDFAALARGGPYDVRFIEYMPLDAEQQWTNDRVVPSRRLFDVINATFPLASDDEHGPAVKFTFADGAPGSVGFISSVSEPFCASCDRVRITADGRLRACLFAVDETDLLSAMRSGADDDAIESLVRSAVASKWAGHNIGSKNFVRPDRSMSQIGG